jgi:hypothetical protein
MDHLSLAVKQPAITSKQACVYWLGSARANPRVFLRLLCSAEAAGGFEVVARYLDRLATEVD